MSLSPDAEIGDRRGPEARAQLGLSLTEPLDDVLAVLERSTGLQIFVVLLGVDGIAGAYQSYRGRTFIIINADNAVQRQRFTLAHEYGHHYLGHGDRYDTSDYFGNSQPTEVQANYFAGAFLMPPAAIDRALERLGRPPIDFDVLTALAIHFGVSAKAMRIRLDTLGRLRPSESRELDERIGNQEHLARGKMLGVTPIIDSLALAKSEGGRPPAAMLERALRAADHGLIDEQKLPELLRTSPSALASQREREHIASE